MTHLRPTIVLILLFTLLTGIVLPIGLSGASTAIFPGPANGSLITRNGKVIGSALLGQNFATAGYFHPRLSVTTDTDPKDSTKTIPSPYNASNSAASNLAPTSKALLDRIKGDVATSGPTPVPADMVTSSASGLDPDISPDNAQRQIARVAKARHLDPARLHSLVETHTQARTLGIFGEPHVNVLALNLALDDLH